MPRSITLYISDHYKRGCPSNSSPRAVGYGLSRDAALTDRIPWANQSPWAGGRVRAEIVTDGTTNPPDCLPENLYYLDGPIADHVKARRWASAVKAYLSS